MEIRELLTADELAAMPDSGMKQELVKGVLVETPPPQSAHMFLAAWIAHLLISYVVPRKLGRVGTEGGHVLDPHTVRAPYVSFTAGTRLVDLEDYIVGAPDLAVEVVSPDDRPRDIAAKVGDYLAAGAQLVWVVYPFSKVVVVYTPGAPALVLHSGDALEGGDVLPGLVLPVADIFSVLEA